jgi:asparagine synthase (glutamine-hydrolysing)
MRHASKVRGKMTLPFEFAPFAEVSGHGGEIAHGFYYTTPRALAKLGGGEEAAAERLAQAARRRHHAATASAYARGREAVAATLEEGRRLGVEGPALLDWFYLAERFSHRSGLAADTQRFTFFSCQGFLRAAFALTPQERLTDRLHRDLTARLVPAWADVPYFEAEQPKGPIARLRRRRHRPEKRSMIWEGEDGAELDAMIAAGGAWTSMYEPDRVWEMLGQCRAGRPDSHFQDPFEGIAYRMAFDDHLELLGRRAAAGEPLFPASATGD